MNKQDAGTVGSQTMAPGIHRPKPLVTSKITWTAIPHGISGPSPYPLSPGGKLYVSVHVSPRLTSSTSKAQLGDFSDWQSWPTTLAGLTFKVSFAGGPTFQGLKAPDGSPPDRGLWQNVVFPPSTLVNSFAFEDYSKSTIRSYPLARIHADIIGRFQTVIRAIARDPSLAPPTGQMKELLASIPILDPDEMARLQTYLEQGFQQAKVQGTKILGPKAIPPEPLGTQSNGMTELDYAQVDAFYHRTVNYPLSGRHVKTAGRQSESRADLAMPTAAELAQQYDFHAMVAALGNHPALLRALGLVVDLEIDLTDLNKDAWAQIRTGSQSTSISVTPSNYEPSRDVVTETYYALDPKSSTFLARPAASSYLTPQLQLQLGNKKSHTGKLNFVVKSPYALTQIDVDGAALKLLAMKPTVVKQFALLAGTGIFGGDQGQTLPSVRSAGLSLIHTGRAQDLAQHLANAISLNQNAANGQAVKLYADDLVRGYALDIWDNHTKRWHQLCARAGAYGFMGFPNTQVQLPPDDEGFVVLAAAQSPTGSPTDLYLHEEIARWHGWSLAVRRPFTAIGLDPDDEVSGTSGDDSGSTEDSTARLGSLGLDTTQVGAPGKSLPRLRFGRAYRMRARMVDIAGNKKAFAPLEPTTDPTTLSDEILYGRWEPLAAPAFMLRQSIAGSPGESMARLVIRSDVAFGIGVEEYYSNYQKSHPKWSLQSSGTTGNRNGTATPYTPNLYAERHILPPITSVSMAETHGMFDAAPSWHNPLLSQPWYDTWQDAWYDVVNTLDLASQRQPKDPGNADAADPTVAHPEAELMLPYTPDPIAAGVTFSGLPGVADGKIVQVLWGDQRLGATWPFLGTMRLVVKGTPLTLHFGKQAGKAPASPPPAIASDATTGIQTIVPVKSGKLMALKAVALQYPADVNVTYNELTVQVPPGQMFTVTYSSFMPAKSLLQMGMTQWIAGAGLSKHEQESFGEAMLTGRAWLLTPFHQITLVHAVQHPLIRPGFSDRFQAVRDIGDTSAQLSDLPMPISGNSTVKLDFNAHWYEPIDDVSQPSPAVLDNNAHVSEVPIQYAETEVEYPGQVQSTILQNPALAAEYKKHFVHEFGSTKYHRVSYRAVATTRYKEYFPPEITANPDNITWTSEFAGHDVVKPQPTKAKAATALDPQTDHVAGLIDVPSSARPQSPNLLYVLPTNNTQPNQ